jgi:hypothetical protein
MKSFSLFRELFRQISNNNTQNQFSAQEHLQAAIDWISVAQDVTGNGGVSLRYSLLFGWAPSYPETTGYIIPTFLNFNRLTRLDEFKRRAIQMADWELTIQNSDGSFKGGPLGEKSGRLVFDTGQIIFGLIEAYRKTHDKKYIQAAIRAGDWLIRVQDDDGAWRQFAYYGLAHTYYARVAWALAELAIEANEKRYETASRRNIEWALSNQLLNGWFKNAGFTIAGHENPSTHTIAYSIRGILETGICLSVERYILSAQRSADALLPVMNPEGFFWGTYNSDWKSSSKYTCLTGNAQISIVLSRLYQLTKNTKYLQVIKALNHYLKSKQLLNTKDKNVRGALPGSYPIWGKYERFSCPNWAAKFFIDALLIEDELKQVSLKDNPQTLKQVL